MTTPALTITDRVQAGAAWLDEHRPGWWQRIDLDTLALDTGCNCVLGQEYAREAALTEAEDGFEFAVVATPLATLVARGFYVDFTIWTRPIDDPDAWNALTDAWRELILARRAGTLGGRRDTA